MFEGTDLGSKEEQVEATWTTEGFPKPLTDSRNDDVCASKDYQRDTPEYWS